MLLSISTSIHPYKVTCTLCPIFCGLGSPLTNISPVTTGGKIVDVYISFIGMALENLIIGVAGSLTVVNRRKYDNESRPKFAFVIYSLIFFPM
jgi:hypothetical protein